MGGKSPCPWKTSILEHLDNLIDQIPICKVIACEYLIIQLKSISKTRSGFKQFPNFRKVLNVPNEHITDTDPFAKSIIFPLYLDSSRKKGTGEGEMTGR